ncbi:hypothetical protein C8J57DRAFT_1509528 [Mycena rebaudengoi]|nr:hypothetical protein C8J57DRAFT_1509528 [Mycena rebaudengoi]
MAFRDAVRYPGRLYPSFYYILFLSTASLSLSARIHPARPAAVRTLRPWVLRRTAKRAGALLDAARAPAAACGMDKARVVGEAIGAALVASFPGLMERESADLPRTAKSMSSLLVQTLTANPLVYAYLRHLASKPEPAAPIHELIRLQSAFLPGFNRAVSNGHAVGVRRAGGVGGAEGVVGPCG